MENDNSNKDETIKVYMRIRPTIKNHPHISKVTWLFTKIANIIKFL